MGLAFVLTLDSPTWIFFCVFAKAVYFFKGSCWHRLAIQQRPQTGRKDYAFIRHGVNNEAAWQLVQLGAAVLVYAPASFTNQYHVKKRPAASLAGS